MSKRATIIDLPGGLILACPYCDLDGTYWPGCEHQEPPDDPYELALIRAVACSLVDLGMPRPFVRVGEKVRTTWGCERNKRKQYREATITEVMISIRCHYQSLWYRPLYEYIGTDGNYNMALTHIQRADGAVREEGWWRPSSPFRFRVEWKSPNTGRIESGLTVPFLDHSEEYPAPDVPCFIQKMRAGSRIGEAMQR